MGFVVAVPREKLGTESCKPTRVTTKAFPNYLVPHRYSPGLRHSGYMSASLHIAIASIAR